MKKFGKSNQASEEVIRNQVIYLMHSKGKSYVEIAKFLEINISRQRMSKIFHREKARTLTNRE